MRNEEEKAPGGGRGGDGSEERAERWRSGRREARGARRRRAEESAEGCEVTGMRTRGAAGGEGLPARASPRRAPALRSLQPRALTLSQLRGRHSAGIVFPKLLFYKVARGGGGAGPDKPRREGRV